MKNFKVNSDRLWESLMKMAKIGETEKGGVCRLALTDVDKKARDLFVQWCESSGCKVTVDEMGNIFGRREGKNSDLAPVMTGSHIDSQPTGGKFDGIYGVLAGLEVIRTLNDMNIETERSIEVSAWTNEEGSRFAPAMIASGVFGGIFDLEYGLSREDSEGNSIGDELKRIGYAGPEKCGGREISAFFEAHIEQGPILESEEKTIGVVQGVQGMRWYDIEVTGMESHAGTTPMDRRKDAIVCASRMVEALDKLGNDNKPDARTTCGVFEISPGSRNVIPGHVSFTADIRHPDSEILADLGIKYKDTCKKIAEEMGIELKFDEIWYSPPVKFDSACVNAVEGAANSLGMKNRPITSGAGHDAVYISNVAPAGMIFIPCEDGISHNEIEAATKEDIAAGCDVLLNAMLERANSI